MGSDSSKPSHHSHNATAHQPTPGYSGGQQPPQQQQQQYKYNPGGQPPPPPPKPAHGSNVQRGEDDSPQANMDKIENTIDLITKRIQVFEKKADTETEKAKKLMEQGNKSGALQCMKRKKQYEQQAQQQTAQLNNLETLKTKLQEAAMNSEVVDATRIGAAEMQKMNHKMNADQIADEKDKLQDAMDQQNDVTAALGEQLDGGLVADEDDLMGELGDMMGADQQKQNQAEAAGLQHQLAGMNPAPTGKIGGGAQAHPSRPAVTTTSRKVNANDELAALEAGLQ